MTRSIVELTAVLKAEIQQEHSSFRVRSLKIGQLLIEARILFDLPTTKDRTTAWKEKVKENYVLFFNWATETTGLSKETCKSYMRIARNPPLVDIEREKSRTNKLRRELLRRTLQHQTINDGPELSLVQKRENRITFALAALAYLTDEEYTETMRRLPARKIAA